MRAIVLSLPPHLGAGFDIDGEDSLQALHSGHGCKGLVAGFLPGLAFRHDLRAEHGSFGSYLADWPVTDTFGLWADIKRRGDRLGGHTGGYFLRFIGKDTPMFSRDVVRALVEQGIVDKEPTSKRDLGAAQAAFNQWREESGRDLCQISRVLACSVP